MNRRGMANFASSLWFLCGCAAGPPPGPTLAPAAGVAPGPEKALAPAPPPLPALTERESAIRAELERDVTKLATEIGERHVEEKWNLATAADWLASSFDGAGYQVTRQGYQVDDVAVQNFEALVPGGWRGRESIVIGAHYDTVAGSPGADDNASGVAAMLALARAFYGAKPSRTLRFVAFVNEEAPFFGTREMGSMFYAGQTSARGERIAVMINLESLGYFSDAPRSQHYPSEVAGRFSTTGRFIAMVGNHESQRQLDAVLSLFRRHASIPVEGAALSPAVPGVSEGDHSSFWHFGFPAVMVTDTARFRNPHYHSANDRPERLDFGRMARVVAGLEVVIRELAGRDPDLTKETPEVTP